MTRKLVMPFLKKRAFPATLILLAMAWPARSEPAPGDVHWYSTLDEASMAAKESGRPMLVDFWADWCTACKVMDKDVYSDPAFAEAAHHFVAVRINFDKKTATARKYNVSELPTLVYTDSFGAELFRHTGVLDGRPLAELLRSLPTDVSEFNRLDQVLAQDKNDFHALKDMAEKLRAVGLFLMSNEYYGRALDTKDAKVELPERVTILKDMGANSLELKDGKQAADSYEKCLKDFPNGAQSVTCTLGLGDAYALADKKDKAKKILEELIREHPGTVESQKAQALLESL